MSGDLHNLNIAIIGATGKVGEVTLNLLAKRGHPAERIIAVASARSVGKRLPYLGGALTVQAMSDAVLKAADVAFISATNAISAELAPQFAKNGALAVDDSSVFRLDSAVPLVVPEVNGADVEAHKGIIAIPNCTVSPLVMVLAPLRKLANFDKVTMATYQAVSGAGNLATQEMFAQMRALATNPTAKLEGENFPVQIAANIIPQVGDFGKNGYSSEEMKADGETRKILHNDKLRVGATCVRVPVEISHSADVVIEFDAPVSPTDARAELERFAGVQVVDDAELADLTPINTAGKDAVFVGRIRRDLVHENALRMWFVCDNLLKGAALNALQIVDEVMRRKPIMPKKPKKAKTN